MPNELTEEQRRSIFGALVVSQDEGKTVGISRSLIAERFDIGIQVVVAIEQEGLKSQWPPL